MSNFPQTDVDRYGVQKTSGNFGGPVNLGFSPSPGFSGSPGGSPGMVDQSFAAPQMRARSPRGVPNQLFSGGAPSPQFGRSMYDPQQSFVGGTPAPSSPYQGMAGPSAPAAPSFTGQSQSMIDARDPVLEQRQNMGLEPRGTSPQSTFGGSPATRQAAAYQAFSGNNISPTDRNNLRGDMLLQSPAPVSPAFNFSQNRAIGAANVQDAQTNANFLPQFNQGVANQQTANTGLTNAQTGLVGAQTGQINQYTPAMVNEMNARAQQEVQSGAATPQTVKMLQQHNQFLQSQVDRFTGQQNKIGAGADAAQGRASAEAAKQDQFNVAQRNNLYNLVSRGAQFNTQDARADPNLQDKIWAEVDKRLPRTSSATASPQPNAAPAPTAQPSAQPDDGIPVVQTPDEAMKLPPGTQFKTPDGRIKVR